MPDSLRQLIRDTLGYLKDPLLSKQTIFAAADDCTLFQKVPSPISPQSAQGKAHKQAPESKYLARNPSPEVFVRQDAVRTTNGDGRAQAQNPAEKEGAKIRRIPNDIPDQDLPGSPDGELPLSKKLQGMAPLPSIAPQTKAVTPVESTPTPVKKEKVPEAPEGAGHSQIKKTLLRIAPAIRLAENVPDDAGAKRAANAWKEKITDAEVVLLACETDADTLEFLKSLGKAIDKNLAKAKILPAEKLEKENRWDLFLQKNQFRLIIASDGMQKLPELMRFYKALPAKSQYYLDRTPLLPLSSAPSYKSLEHKALLWKTLCQMLRK